MRNHDFCKPVHSTHDRELVEIQLGIRAGKKTMKEGAAARDRRRSTREVQVLTVQASVMRALLSR